MQIPFLTIKRVRICLIVGLFFLSVSTVITMRAIAPALATSVDAAALLECAVRFSKTGVASSALFPGFTEVITDAHPYPEMRWWPTGIPKIMGCLMKLGFGLEAVFRAVVYVSIAFLWLGWFLVVKEAGSLNVLATKPLLAAGFCLCPLFLTPRIDIDEMVFAAIVPWVIFLTSKICNSRRWWLHLFLLQLVFLLSYQIRYSSLLFPLLSMSAFGLILLRKDETKQKRFHLTVSLVLSCATLFFLLILKKIYPPDFLADVHLSISDKISRLIYSVGNSGYNSLFWSVNWFMPGRIVDFYEEILNSWQFLGFLSALLHLLAIAIVAWKCFKKSKLSKSNLILFLGVSLLAINYAMVIYADINGREYLNLFLLYFINYWHPYLPLTVILMIMVYKRESLLRNTVPHLVSLIPVVLFALMVLGLSKQPIALLRGFYFSGEENLRDRKSIVQNTPSEFFLPEDILKSSGIFYTQFAQFYSLIHHDCKLQFRPPPLVSEFSRYRTITPVTVYFCLTESEMKEKYLHPGVRKAAFPKSELLTLDELFESVKLTDDMDRLLRDHLVFQSSDAYIFRFDLPADWRGKNASERVVGISP